MKTKYVVAIAPRIATSWDEVPNVIYRVGGKFLFRETTDIDRVPENSTVEKKHSL